MKYFFLNTLYGSNSKRLIPCFWYLNSIEDIFSDQSFLVDVHLLRPRAIPDSAALTRIRSRLKRYATKVADRLGLSSADGDDAFMVCTSPSFLMTLPTAPTP
jgi:hypothetical protein